MPKDSPGRVGKRRSIARPSRPTITAEPHEVKAVYYIKRKEKEMDANFWVELVRSVGFPIVMCGALFWKMNKSDEEHKAEQEKMAEALNNNTVALTRLADKMEGDAKNG